MSKEVLESVLNELSYPIYTEYKFHSKRKFRFDYYIELSNNKGLAIEYEGMGIKSRHQSFNGFIRDCEKYNLALSLGVPVLRYTFKNLENIELVKQQIIDVINKLRY
jgi:hypothetical protein